MRARRHGSVVHVEQMEEEEERAEKEKPIDVDAGIADEIVRYRDEEKKKKDEEE